MKPSPTATERLTEISDDAPAEIVKTNAETRAWRIAVRGEAQFVKFYSAALYETRTAAEIAIAGANLHPAIIPLRAMEECDDGHLLFYPWAEGRTLSGLEERQKFYALPDAEKIPALCTAFDALASIAEAGWVLRDVYEGNLLYDYARREIRVFDFDLCIRGDGYFLEMERNYGSSRLMAPEEFGRGAWIDGSTNAFNLARIAQTALTAPPPALAAVLIRATEPNREARYPTVRAFSDAFSAIASSLTSRT